MKDTEREERRTRWRLAKRAQRERKKVSAVCVSPAFLEAVADERDRRETIAARASRRMNGIYVDVTYRCSGFVADVWMAKVLLQAELGDKGATPTRVARWLWENQRNGDYKQGSLRPMVYRALAKITELETDGCHEDDPPFWKPWRERNT